MQPALRTRVFRFLLLPEFSVMGFVSALEPLRVANRFLENAYQWRILSLDGGPVVASNGMSLNVDGAICAVAPSETVFVVAGFNPLDHYQRTLQVWLHSAWQAGAALGAIDTGAFVLAEARLLGSQPVTLHWEAKSAFLERYPALRVTDDLFTINDRCMTCAGGTSAIDMMLALIAQEHGKPMAAMVSEQFVLGRIRSQADQQRMQIATRYGLHNSNAVRVIEAMEQHIEDPLTPEKLAALIGVSRRQMERLFRSHLQQTPAYFYLCLRLARARELLQQTALSVMAICVACGFGSASCFSRAYRSHFGVSPTADRASNSHVSQAIKMGN
jgi:AraC family carnitine catabolism transcriptional activator